MSWCVDALIGSLWSEPPWREGRWCDKQIWCLRTKLNEYGRSTNKGHILRRGRSCTKSAKMIFRQGLCQGSDSGRFHWRETYFETGFATGQWTSPANRTTPIFSLRHFKQYDSYEDKAMCQSDNQNDKKITEMSAVILQKKLQLEDDRERLDGRTKDWQFDSFLSLHQDCVNKNPTRADSSDFKKFQNLNENLSACVWSAGKEIVRMNENILCYQRTGPSSAHHDMALKLNDCRYIYIRNIYVSHVYIFVYLWLFIL